jgi:hypothetical protein
LFDVSRLAGEDMYFVLEEMINVSPKALYEAFCCCEEGSAMNLVLPYGTSIMDAAVNSIAFADELFKGLKGYFTIPVRVSIFGTPEIFIIVYHDTNPDDAAEELIDAFFKAESDPIIAMKIAYRKFEDAKVALNADPSNSALAENMFKLRHELNFFI